MKTPQHNKNQELETFDFISNELKEEFITIYSSLNDVIIIE